MLRGKSPGMARNFPAAGAAITPERSGGELGGCWATAACVDTKTARTASVQHGLFDIIILETVWVLKQLYPLPKFVQWMMETPFTHFDQRIGRLCREYLGFFSVNRAGPLGQAAVRTFAAARSPRPRRARLGC